MFQTKTGSFPIGFRRGWSDWQKDLTGLCAWARASGFGHIDVGANSADAEKVIQAGLKVGSADLGGGRGWMSEDPEEVKDCLENLGAHIASCAAKGVTNFFDVMIPKDSSKRRSENFELMVNGLTKLVTILEANNAKLVIEGWPGPGALACTPESLRETFKRVPSKAIGINFDPSHLLRMGIQPAPFLYEFADRVFHVHGKDTAVYPEKMYDFGHEQSATLAQGFGFGSHVWRYTIPGHGITNWKQIFDILVAKGYKGAVCIELEDENFNGTTEGEQEALIASGQFLSHC